MNSNPPVMQIYCQNSPLFLSYCSLCTLDTIHILFFVTGLVINKINKVQWVDFKLENVVVSLHSLKRMSLGSIIFKGMESYPDIPLCLIS